MKSICDAINIGEKEKIFILSDNIDKYNFLVNDLVRKDLIFTTYIIPENKRKTIRLTEDIKEELKRHDVTITLLDKETNLEFRNQLVNARSEWGRIFHMFDVSIEVIKECILHTNYKRLENQGESMCNLLSHGKKLEIITDNGKKTLKMDLGGWDNPADFDTTLIKRKGSWCNLPVGEVWIAPNRETVEGEILIDGAIKGRPLEKRKPIILHFENSTCSKISGEFGERLYNELKSIDQESPPEMKDNIFKIGEFGLGMNEKAKVDRSETECLKSDKACHVSLGDNLHIGGNNPAKKRVSFVFKKPTIKIDGITIMEDGDILFRNYHNICFKNYNEFEPLNVSISTKINPSIRAGIVQWPSEILERFWVTKTGNFLKTQIGDDQTAKLAARVWETIFKHKRDIPVSLIIDYTKIEEGTVKKILQVMKEYRIIEASDLHQVTLNR